MEIDKSLKEFFLHKVQNDFKQRLVAETWRLNQNGQLTIARLNGAINSDEFFMKELGLEAEYQDLKDYYNPDYWVEEYDPETASFKQVRKAEISNV